jgi:alpha-tubulin suppressor-like RCC1 family protein
LVLDSFRQVWSFGSNYYGELGLSGLTDCAIPRLIPKLKDIVEVISGNSSSIVKNHMQQVFVFGANNYYQLGIESNMENVTLVEQVSWRNKTVIPGDRHNLIIDELGNLFLFGLLQSIPNNQHGTKQEGIIIEYKPQFKIKKAV